MNMDMLPVDHVKAETWLLGTDEVTVLASGAQTNGDIFVVQITMPPGGGPPVRHRHEPSEVYYVLRGEFTFSVGDPEGPVPRVTATAGDVVPLSGGTPHTIRNESDSPATAFVVHSPAATMEGFSRSAAALAAQSAGSAPAMAEVLDLAQRHCIEMLGPAPVST